MAWRFEVQIRKTLRLMRWRARRVVTRWPALREHAPLVLALGLNLIFAVLLLSFTPSRLMRGTPHAEPAVIDIYFAPPEPEAGEVSAPDPAPLEETEAPETEQSAETVPEQSPLAETIIEAAPTPTAQEVRAPSSVRVPDVDLGKGTPDGIIALECSKWFDDLVRARECAGARVTSDWRSALTGGDSEQWQKSAERLRSGRYRGPFQIGPDQYGDLGDNEELYQPRDPRFHLGPGPSTSGSTNFAAAFDTQEEYNRYLALQDRRQYIGENTGLDDTYSRSWGDPMSGWRPSWQLRDDPHIDADKMSDFLKELEDADNN